MGRKAVQLPLSQEELERRYLEGETAQELARVCEVSDKLIYRRLKGVKKRKLYHKGTCLEPECLEPTYSRGYCTRHASARRQRGEFSSVPCSVECCPRKAVTKGLCQGHYRRLQRGQALETPLKEIAPKGSGSIDSNGYRRIGRRKEHRVVMEQILGRPLKKKEHVHHLNGIKTDNRPENLELWLCQQPKGQRVSDAVQAAVETLRCYAPELLREGE